MTCRFFLKHRIQNPSYPEHISPDSLLYNSHPPSSMQINEPRVLWLPGYQFWAEWFLPALPAYAHHPDLSVSPLMVWKLSARFVNRREGERPLPRSGATV